MIDPRVPIDQAKFDALMSVYKSATTKLTKEMLSATDYGLASRQAILRNIGGILDNLDEKTSDWFTKQVATSYKLGSIDAAQVLSDDGYEILKKFTAIDQEAIKSITDGIMGYYREAYSGIKREAMSMLADATKTRLQSIIAVGKISGDTKKEIADAIAGKLKDGFISIVDKGGREWSLDTYAEMLTRTSLVRATNDGLQNRLQQEGNDLVQVSDHSADCDLCGPWEGKILSMSGIHPEYDSVDDAENDGLFHPNCRHRLLPYHEKLAEVSSIWNPDTQRYINL